MFISVILHGSHNSYDRRLYFRIDFIWGSAFISSKTGKSLECKHNLRLCGLPNMICVVICVTYYRYFKDPVAEKKPIGETALEKLGEGEKNKVIMLLLN